MLGVLLGLGSSIASTAVSSAINNANAERANKVQRDMQRDEYEKQGYHVHTGYPLVAYYTS